MAATDKPANISSFQHENRVFKPSKEFAKKAHIKSLAEYKKLYNESVKSPDKFVELTTEHTKSVFETFVAHATKIGELYKNFAREVFTPIQPNS